MFERGGGRRRNDVVGRATTHDDYDDYDENRRREEERSHAIPPDGEIRRDGIAAGFFRRIAEGREDVRGGGSQGEGKFNDRYASCVCVCVCIYI